MSWWTKLFGPSQADRLLSALAEERKAQHGLVMRLLDSVNAQTEMQRKQFDLWTAPYGKPEVRTMTPADEALHERNRVSAKVGTQIDPSTVLADFSRDFLNQPPTFDFK